MIPYGRQFIDDADISAVVEVLKSPLITTGPAVKAFEKKLCDLTNAKYALSCSSATAGLHMAMLALEITSDDWIIVPSITFLASANCARYVGANVIFADVDTNTGLLTPETLSRALDLHKNKKIKALVNVHLMGQVGLIEEIHKIARAHDLFIVDDAAHAVGTVYTDACGKPHPVGSNAFSDISVFSFHPVKVVSMGEGGAVTTEDPRLAERLRLARSHGMIHDPSEWKYPEQGGPWYYEMQELGYNYRASDVNCALAVSQLSKLDQFKANRQELVANYDEALSDVPHITPVSRLPNSNTSWHIHVIHIDWELINTTRAKYMQKLRGKGIGTQVHYIPVHQQPYYRSLYGECTLPGAEKYYSSCLTIPMFVGLTPAQQNSVIDELTHA